MTPARLTQFSGVQCPRHGIDPAPATHTHTHTHSLLLPEAWTAEPRPLGGEEEEEGGRDTAEVKEEEEEEEEADQACPTPPAAAACLVFAPRSAPGPRDPGDPGRT